LFVRVLIADDDVTSRTLLTGVLCKEGHQVETVVDGAEAWQALQQLDAPELVILDWMMPKINGPDVLRLVRAHQTESPPYILMLTSRDKKTDIIAGLEAGANDYLAKPFDAGELCARLGVGCRMVEMQNALLASRQALAHQASHDSLTGLLNRSSILDRLQRETARANRSGDEWAVGMCDIDHFKGVNDTYGHQTGDDLLRGFAGILLDRL
jgi:two-component system, cell cycle response regulator